MNLFRVMVLGTVIIAASGCQLSPSERADQPCTSAHPVSVDRIDDRRIQRQIQDTAKRLIEEKKTTSAKKLSGQLDRKTCSLELPSEASEEMPLDRLYTKRRSGIAAVCGIYKCGRCTRWHSGIASGFVVTTDGIIVTNHHVMATKDRETFVVYLEGQGVFPVREVLAASRRNDLALIRIDLPEGKKLKPIPISPLGAVGTSISVISHPSHRFFTLTQGIVSRYFSTTRKGERAPVMAITADYAKGSSGAPVMDPKGAVVGIVSSTNSIYYDEKDGVQRNLQMVVKQCVPSSCLLELIRKGD